MIVLIALLALAQLAPEQAKDREFQRVQNEWLASFTSERLALTADELEQLRKLGSGCYRCRRNAQERMNLKIAVFGIRSRDQEIASRCKIYLDLYLSGDR